MCMTDPYRNSDDDPLEEPIFIVASTDDGREWAATGHPLDLSKLEEVTCRRHEH